MVLLSESSIREMVQEALGGGGYPALDGDGNFPIVPNPLAEPIITKLALQPVRVMRVPTDKQEFELAMKELVDGVEQEHLPSLFLKLRELVSDFSPQPSKDQPTCSKAESMSQDNSDEMKKVRESVRAIVLSVLSEAEEDKDDEESEVVKMWKKKYPEKSKEAPAVKKGAWGQPILDDEDEDGEDTDDDDEDSESLGFEDDPGAAEEEPEKEEYPAEYLASPGYPDIGEDPEFNTWEDFEKELSKSAWEPGAELDKFRGRSSEDEWDKVAAAVEKAAAEPAAKAPKKEKEAVGGEKDWKSIADELGISVGTAHGEAAIGARKLAYIGEYLGFEGFDEFYEKTTDEYINHLLKKGAEKDPETGKPNLDMEDRIDLQTALAYEKNEDDEWVEKKLDPSSKASRKAIQELPSFREFLNVALEKEMDIDGYPWRHKDAAKNKDAFSVFHRMKRTTK